MTTRIMGVTLHVSDCDKFKTISREKLCQHERNCAMCQALRFKNVGKLRNVIRKGQNYRGLDVVV